MVIPGNSLELSVSEVTLTTTERRNQRCHLRMEGERPSPSLDNQRLREELRGGELKGVGG